MSGRRGWGRLARRGRRGSWCGQELAGGPLVLGDQAHVAAVVIALASWYRVAVGAPLGGAGTAVFERVPLGGAGTAVFERVLQGLEPLALLACPGVGHCPASATASFAARAAGSRSQIKRSRLALRCSAVQTARAVS